MAQTFTDAYRSLIRDYLPAGTFWRGAAAERFVDGLVQASAPLMQFIATLYLEVWPFDAQRPMLEQWYDYLYPDSCLPIPVDTEDLRDRVLLAIASPDVGSPDGLAARINAELKLVEVDDLPGPSIVPLEVPSPIDGAAQVVEIWYAPTIDNAATVMCVGRTYAPASAIVRPVTPIAHFRQPTAGQDAADTALHWHEMRSVSQIFLQRFTTFGPTLQETTTFTITQDTDAKTMDELFPLLGPASSLAGQFVEATFRRTWNEQGPTDVLAKISHTF